MDALAFPRRLFFCTFPSELGLTLAFEDFELDITLVETPSISMPMVAVNVSIGTDPGHWQGSSAEEIPLKWWTHLNEAHLQSALPRVPPSAYDVHDLSSAMS